MRIRKRHPGHEIDLAAESDFLGANILLPPQAVDTQQLINAMNQLPATTRSVLWLYSAMLSSVSIQRQLNHRDVMRVLREKKVAEKVNLNVLRGRKLLNSEITTPTARAMPFLTPPPAPPAPSA